MRLCFLAGVGLAATMLVEVPAAAQQIDTGVLDTALPLFYDRGRSVSVLDRKRPEYDPIGIRVGGFTAFPSVQVGVGATSNVFLIEEGKRDDGFATLTPRLRLDSNWSVHKLQFDTGGNLVRYFNQGGRNEDGWHIQGSGEYEFTPDLSFSLTGRTARLYETPFSSVSLLNAREPTPYQSTTVRGLVRTVFARSRLLAALIYNKLDYKSADLLSGLRVDQDYRDRHALTGTGHYEYALTPSTALYAEGSYSRIKYDESLAPGVKNRDAGEWKALAGISFDLQKFARGSIGLGYSRRRFDSPRFRNASGFSAAMQLEYFPTELTTLTLGARREIQDANFVVSSAYFQNLISLRVDHELLYNLLLNANAQYEVDDYIGLPGSVRIFRVSGGARYSLGNRAVLVGNIRYAKRDSSVPVIAADIAERRATIGLLLQR